MEIDSENVSALNDQRYAFCNIGRYDEAITCFDKLLQINPNDAVIWHNKGNTLHKLGRYDEAITCCNKTLEINPENAEAWKIKGTSLGLTKRSDEATICFDTALQIVPNDAYTWIFKGFALYDMERFDEATTCCGNALELDPENDDALKLREKVLRSKAENGIEAKTADEWFQLGRDAEDPETQVECYTEALKLDPENEHAWTLKGSSHIALENYDEAIECFNKALQINPKSLDDTILIKLGCTFGGKGETEKAIWCFTKAIEINPHNDDSWFWKGYVYAQLEKYDDAFECFNNTIKINK